jgi:hypothetical protein
VNQKLDPTQQAVGEAGGAEPSLGICLQRADAARERARNQRRQQVFHEPARGRHLGEEAREKGIRRDHHSERVREEPCSEPARVANIARRNRVWIPSWQQNAWRGGCAAEELLEKIAVFALEFGKGGRRVQTPLRLALPQRLCRTFRHAR